MAQEDNAPSEWEQNVFASVLMKSIDEQKKARRWGIFFKIAFLLYILFITVMIFSKPKSDVLDYHKPHTALVDIKGVIAADDEASGDAIAYALRQAFEATNSKGIILRINSPGGSPVQSAYVYDEVMRLKAKYPEKKVYSVIADIGGSGGYFVAAAGDEIYANKSSIVGSIGVLMMGFGFVDTLDKLGMEQRTLSSGANKQFLDPFSPVDPEQKAFANELLANIHQHFIDAVVQGRGDRLKQDPAIFSGLFWTGEQALELGLIDGFGSPGYVARELIKEEDIVEYSMPRSFFDKIGKRFGVALKKSLKMQVDDFTPEMVIR